MLDSDPCDSNSSELLSLVKKYIVDVWEIMTTNYSQQLHSHFSLGDLVEVEGQRNVVKNDRETCTPGIDIILL